MEEKKKVQLINDIHQKYPQLQLDIYTTALWRMTNDELQKILDGQIEVFNENEMIKYLNKRSIRVMVRKSLSYDTMEKKIGHYKKEIQVKTIDKIIKIIEKESNMIIEKILKRLEKEKENV